MLEEIPESQTRIDSEQQYEMAVRTLSKRARAPRLLRLLMQALEGYRQARRMGWSRRHNKYGVRTFASFKLGNVAAQFAAALRPVFAESFEGLSARGSAFVEDLFVDDNLMGFLFFQECTDQETGELFESVTISLGRVVAGQKRFRDRVDVVLDAPVHNMTVGELSRVRLYVDQFVEHSPIELSAEGGYRAQELLSALSSYYEKHRLDEALIWDHWTQDYIDYFGPRQRPLLQTRFPTEIDDAYARLRAHNQSVTDSCQGAA